MQKKIYSRICRSKKNFNIIRHEKHYSSDLCFDLISNRDEGKKEWYISFCSIGVDWKF